MFLCLELFHPGKVTSFSHRLIAVPLNLALVPQSALCSGVECLPVGLGDWLAVLLIWNALHSPWFFLWLWNPSSSRPGLTASCVVPGLTSNLTRLCCCLSLLQYSPSAQCTASLSPSGWLPQRERLCPVIVPLGHQLWASFWVMDDQQQHLHCSGVSQSWAQEHTPLLRRAQPWCSPDRIC